MRDSRLSRKVVRRTERNIILTLAGCVLILFLVFQYGLPALVNTIFFFSGSSNTADVNSNKKNTFIAPPILNQTFSATNSAEVKISGSALSQDTILLYVNDSLVDKKKPAKDLSFEFEEVRLKPGDNTIQAKIEKDGKKSDFSNEVTIAYKSSAPSLTIDNPSDGQSFAKETDSIEVKGKTDSGVKVYINDFWAIVDDEGNFSYNLRLKEGENQIKIQAIDDAGNKTEQTRKVTRSS